ncbi:MAG: hypothetical protein ACOC5T_02260 [Elusimicrobiota bacterium]
MKELNSKQIKLLIEIGKQTGKLGMREIGKKVYNTYVSIHENIYLFRDYDLISLERNQNKIVPFLTQKGKDTISERFN